MADYKTSFIFFITGTAQEIARLRGVFEAIDFSNLPDEEITVDDFEAEGVLLNQEDFEFLSGLLSENGRPDVDVMLDKPETMMTVLSDGGGNLETLMPLLQWWLRDRGIEEAIQFDFAYTSSPMRADGFGGGAVHITADEVTWLDTKSWMRAELARTHPVNNGEDPAP